MQTTHEQKREIKVEHEFSVLLNLEFTYNFLRLLFSHEIFAFFFCASVEIDFSASVLTRGIRMNVGYVAEEN